jgi:hypothetical protein
MRGYGYGNAIRPVTQSVPQANANRIEYRHGTLTEWHLNGPLGLEQGFTISKPPEGNRGLPLTISLTLPEGLKPVVGPGARDVKFLRPDGQAIVVAYGGLAAYDKNGRQFSIYRNDHCRASKKGLANGLRSLPEC